MFFFLISIYILFISYIFGKTFSNDDRKRFDKFGAYYKSSKVFNINNHGFYFIIFIFFNTMVYSFFLCYHVLYLHNFIAIQINFSWIYYYIYISTFINNIYFSLCAMKVSTLDFDLKYWYWYLLIFNILILVQTEYSIIGYFFYLLCLELIKVFFLNKNLVSNYKNKASDYFFFRK